MLKTIALIPARAGSKRIKDKNIYLLNGKPLISFSLDYAINAACFERIIVVTDSKKYAEIALKHKNIEVFMRPKHTAKDNSPDIEWVKWTLNKVSEEGFTSDLFCILRPTNPSEQKQ